MSLNLLKVRGLLVSFGLKKDENFDDKFDSIVLHIPVCLFFVE